MPIYGLEKCAIASSIRRRMNENRLPTLITRPDKLSQFRSRDGRAGNDGSFSVLMQNLFSREFWPRRPFDAPARLLKGSTYVSRFSLRIAHYVSCINASLLQSPQVGDDGFCLVVRNSFRRLHNNFSFLVLGALFDGLDGGIIC